MGTQDIVVEDEVPGGRPPVPDEERKQLIRKVCSLILQVSVEEACKEIGINERTFWVWLSADEELQQEYARVREAIGHKDEYAVEKLVVQAENGQIDPAAARVAIDGRKWLAGKRNPKVYGEKQAVELTGKNGGKIEHDVSIPGLSQTFDFLGRIAAARSAGALEESGEDRPLLPA